MRNAKIINLLKSRKTLVLWLLLLVAVAVVGAVVITQRSHNGKTQLAKNVAFAIDGKNYSKQSIKQLIAYPVSTGTSQDKAARQAFDMLKQIRAAQKLGYTPTQSEINYQKNQIFQTLKTAFHNYALYNPENPKYSDWFNLTATAAAVNTFVNSPVAVGYSGHSYVFFFGQHLQSSPDYKPSGLNDSKLVAQDKAYAKQKANYYHQQLQDNKLSPADALTKAGADMQARGHSVNNPNFNATFSSQPGQQNLSTAVFLPDIVHYISSQHSTGLSGVRTGKAPNAPTKSGGKNVDMYYYFVDLTAAPKSSSITPTHFNDALKKLSAIYGGVS